MSQQLEQTLQQAQQKISSAETLAELDLTRVEYLGKSGVFTGQLKHYGIQAPVNM